MQTHRTFSLSSTSALWLGIAFSLLFTGLIAWAGQRLEGVALLPDTGASWYYWQLPEPAFWPRATAWVFYLAHQLTLFGLIYYAQTHELKYTGGLHRINVIALGASAFFILLHFVQSHLWYDGLAQDVSIWSSQGSVIVLLVWVLLMENNRRGMFFGRRLPLSKEIIRVARKYHGYFFAWAVVYTFWYHPMVSTSGHLVGFFYMFLIMLQGSLFFTRVHVNRLWTLALEVSVLIHGTLVAVMQGNGIWPMFAFGFGGVFVITQMHGVGWSRAVRSLVALAYVAAVLVVYSERGWDQLNEIVRIPIIDYLLVLILAGLFGLGIWIARRLRPTPAPAAPASPAV
jgi:hypothetical protein